MRHDVPPFYGWGIEIIEVIDHGNAPTAFRDESINEMRADETGAAGDENVLHVIFGPWAFAFGLWGLWSW